MSWFQRWLNKVELQQSGADTVMSFELAAAILMIEIGRADFNASSQEMEKTRELLINQLGIAENAVEDLMQLASSQADDLVSLQHITRYLNDQKSQVDKNKIIGLMWQVVYADGVKHHYEESMMRQVADLLYISHEEYTKARHAAEPD